MIAEAAAGQGGMDLGFLPNQKQGRDPVVGLNRPEGAFDDDSATVIATHDIHCDAHREDKRAKVGSRAAERIRPPPSP
jgi:hypothetical protein